MISDVRTDAETHAPNQMTSAARTVDAASISEAWTSAAPARKTSWTKVFIDELVQSLALISKFPHR